MPDENIEKLIKYLPDPDLAQRFYFQLEDKFPFEVKKLNRDEGLLSDILTLASFSPLLATTLLQNPKYISWIKRQKISQKVRNKEEILESLARFALTNSSVETNILLARFRRRELLRIYLRDIRNLGTIAEITEEISNLADAILEYALRIAHQELDNRYGQPFETDENGRSRHSFLCIVALGKLGSKELNYSSDIDLLFLYSGEGSTTGIDDGKITNREYFVKLAQLVSKLVGGQSGEGAAYRVDLRLRPNGRVGALAISLAEAINYYRSTARTWERQVLIRSRASAGSSEIFQKFFESVKSNVFSVNQSVEEALESVRLSKEQIDFEKNNEKAFDVKLGKGGIREIEFIAQALQLAFGGKDEWIRSPHTLISLNRLADRNLLSETELTQLFEAYTFLRRLEHRLQMINGLQTHLVPADAKRRLEIAKRMNIRNAFDFEAILAKHTANVNQIFIRIFGSELIEPRSIITEDASSDMTNIADSEEPGRKTKDSRGFRRIITSLEKYDFSLLPDAKHLDFIKQFSGISPHFAEMVAANPGLLSALHFDAPNPELSDYQKMLDQAINSETDFVGKISALRKKWSAAIIGIAAADVFREISRESAKNLQTKLAEASICAAISITRAELESRLKTTIDDFPFAVLGLGKLGGGGMDYGSDLDLVLIYDQTKPLTSPDLTHAEFYARAVEIFVNALSSLTRDGLLYRVDLRLRPDGKNGASCTDRTAFLNYLSTRSAIWEWLAYVKLRGVSGDIDLAISTESEARIIIHKNAGKCDKEMLRKETLRVRDRLEKEKSSAKKGRDIDIKFGEGGMLDIYFAMRYLQLRDDVPDDIENRSTSNILIRLFEKQSLSKDDFESFSSGYRFLSELDHNLRLTIGRSTFISSSNRKMLGIIASRMDVSGIEQLHEQLSLHRLNIRHSFENILNSAL